jgi:hypothetical protein
MGRKLKCIHLPPPIVYECFYYTPRMNDTPFFWFITYRVVHIRMQEGKQQPTISYLKLSEITWRHSEVSFNV